MTCSSGRTGLRAVIALFLTTLVAATFLRPMGDVVALNSAYLQLSRYAVGEEAAALAAGKQLSQLVNKDSSLVQTEAAVGLAFLVLRQGDPYLVLSLLASLPPGDRAPLGALWRGHALLATGRVDQAIETWKQAGVTSDYVVGYGELAGSKEWYGTASRLSPTSHTYILIGTAYRRAGQTSQAILSLEKALELDVGWEDDSESFRARYQLALALWAGRQSWPDRVERAFREILPEAEAHYQSALPIIYGRLGALAEGKGDYAAASAWYRRLTEVSITPENLLMLGQAVYLATGGLEAARRQFDLALETSESNPDVLRRICRFLFANGAPEAGRGYCGQDTYSAPD